MPQLLSLLSVIDFLSASGIQALVAGDVHRIVQEMRESWTHFPPLEIRL